MIHVDHGVNAGANIPRMGLALAGGAWAAPDGAAGEAMVPERRITPIRRVDAAKLTCVA